MKQRISQVDAMGKILTFIDYWRDKVKDYSDTIILNNMRMERIGEITADTLNRMTALEKKWSLKHESNENHLATK